MPLSESEVQLAVTALQALIRVGLTAVEVKALLEGPEPTEATVRDALSRSRAAIANARKD